jgi:predicted nucleic-acid-binding Zn-ribbon protein
MKATGRCPKCGKSDIIKDALAIDRGHGNSRQEMTVATFAKPEAFIFKEMRSTSVSAWICAACGFVEFYADNPETIKLPGR